MTKSDDKRVPTLRFKGFTDEWEQRKLGDVAKIVGGGTPSTNISNYWNGNINWYSPTEIGNQIFVNSSKKKITELGLKESSAKLLPGKKTILFTSRAGIGDMAIMKTDGSTNQGFQSWIVKPDIIDIYFLYSLGSKLKRQALRKASGSTFLEISNSEVKKLSLYLPDFEEQTIIGKIIKLIDKLITLQQRKLERLKSLKKAYLRLIFNTSESIHYLKDIAEYRRGSFPQPYTKREWYGGKDSQPFVQVADVNTNLRLFSKTKETISKKAQQNSVFVPKDTIVVTLQGSIGRVAITQYDSYVDRTLLIITKLKKRIDKYYLAYALQEKFNIEKRKAPGGTIKTITKSTLSNFAIILPNFEKQSQQSQTLKTIDNEIYLINKKLDKLVQFKQFLLQNMFI